MLPVTHAHNLLKIIQKSKFTVSAASTDAFEPFKIKVAADLIATDNLSQIVGFKKKD